jgi:hypothetical protein
MSHNHLASVPDPSINNRSADRQSPQLWQQPIRSPEIQAEVERIGSHDPYVAVPRSSEGQIRPLYDLLKQIAVWHLDNSQIEINANNISTLLTTVQGPQIGLE